MKDSTSDEQEAVRTAFAGRLVALRRAYGRMSGQTPMPQARFARALGISAGRYRRYEAGDVEPPLFVLRQIREVTGISLCSLVAGLPPGAADMLTPVDVEPPVTMGMRIRWTRMMMDAGLAETAELMGCTERTWTGYEYGYSNPPASKMLEFAHRFSVSMDFLYSGSLLGLPDDVRAELLRLHPELSRQSDSDKATGGDIFALRKPFSHGDGTEA